MQQMIKAVLTPPHSYPLKALLNEPFTGTFNHATANRQPHFLELTILNVCQVSAEIISDLEQDWFGGVSGIFRLTQPVQFFNDAFTKSVTQLMAHSGKPLLRCTSRVAVLISAYSLP